MGSAHNRRIETPKDFGEIKKRKKISAIVTAQGPTGLIDAGLYAVNIKDLGKFIVSGGSAAF